MIDLTKPIEVEDALDFTKMPSIGEVKEGDLIGCFNARIPDGSRDPGLKMYDPRREAYRRLFEEAPRTKLERDVLEGVANVLAGENEKMLALLVRIKNEITATSNLDQDDEWCDLWQQTDALIREIETPRPTVTNA